MRRFGVFFHTPGYHLQPPIVSLTHPHLVRNVTRTRVVHGEERGVAPSQVPGTLLVAIVSGELLGHAAVGSSVALTNSDEGVGVGADAGDDGVVVA